MTTTETNGIENTKRIDPLVHQLTTTNQPSTVARRAIRCAAIRDYLWRPTPICTLHCTALVRSTVVAALGGNPNHFFLAQPTRDGWTWNDDPSLASLSLSLSLRAVAIKPCFSSLILTKRAQQQQHRRQEIAHSAAFIYFSFFSLFSLAIFVLFL